MTADAVGDGFEAVAELVDLVGEPGEGELLAGGVAVAVDDLSDPSLTRGWVREGS